MKILTGKQIRAADMATIANEPIESVALMERAAEMIAQAVCNRVEEGGSILFMIGKGNNGGDGLAVARMLSRVGFHCAVCMLFPPEELSEDCRINYERLPEEVVRLQFGTFEVSDDTIIVDAVLGSGIAGEVRGRAADAIKWMNSLPNTVIAIDLPSGMKTEFNNAPKDIVNAEVTLTIEFPKLAMLLPETGDCCGEIQVLPIELDPEFIDAEPSRYYYTTEDEIKGLVKPRRKFGHKGDYGHALLVCGSRSMPGAAVLATSGALRSGCGLVTSHVPESIATALSSNAPSAMLSLEQADVFITLPGDMIKFTSIGAGCGIGTASETRYALEMLMRSAAAPMVLDADALNIIAEHDDLRKLIPANSILTPHPGEFRRLAGKWDSEEEKLDKLVGLACGLNSVVVLKGAYTAVCSPGGEIHFNPTGTPAMAKGGSGDILTGLMTGLLAKGYKSFDAARLGVWLHGRAGEKAAGYYSTEGMNSADIIDFLSEAWSEIQ